ncbi:hypothetical protein BDQ17DRAFT_1341615 [Cyathus striatus]|nr:hypothetical protein BDQ17DRAFT_1341615 [Cyathus striatus]
MERECNKSWWVRGNPCSLPLGVANRPKIVGLNYNFSMSSLLPKFSQVTIPRPIAHVSVRNYAVEKPRGRPETSVDPKKENIRRALYPGNLRNRPTPVGTWRPDVGHAIQRAIPSVQAHETIERAWKLFLRHQRKGREAELERKFACMKNAMDELAKIDNTLYIEANKPEDPKKRLPAEMELLKSLKTAEFRIMEGRIRGLFPRELRPPTDTPARSGWNYEWKPFPRPL